MAIPKFTLYKHVKLDSGWRYCKAAWHSDSKVKPNVVLVNIIVVKELGNSKSAPSFKTAVEGSA